MDLSKRRGFLKGFGLIGAVTAGAFAPVVIEKMREVESSPITPTVDPKIIAQIEEINPSSLSLHQTYGEIEPPKPPPPPSAFTTNGIYTISNGGTYTTTTNSALVLNNDGNVNIGLNRKNFIPGTEKHIDVKLVPGPDGELYLNVNGQWKKVLTV